MITFSIITVTRNNRSGLQITANSLQTQTCRDFEWIIIDGDSSDGTKDDLPGLPARTLSEPDGGIYDAMNKGIPLAQGQYILFLNAGDQLATPETLARLIPYCNGDDFIYGDALEGGQYKAARRHKKMVMGRFTHHQSMLYRRLALQSLRYDTDYKIAADYKFTALHLLGNPKAHYAPFPICIFAQGGVSQTETQTGRIEQFFVREELGLCPAHVNVALYLAQTLWLAVRRYLPGVYWTLKRGMPH